MLSIRELSKGTQTTASPPCSHCFRKPRLTGSHPLQSGRTSLPCRVCGSRHCYWFFFPLWFRLHDLVQISFVFKLYSQCWEKFPGMNKSVTKGIDVWKYPTWLFVGEISGFFFFFFRYFSGILVFLIYLPSFSGWRGECPALRWTRMNLEQCSLSLTTGLAFWKQGQLGSEITHCLQWFELTFFFP